jgi:hypothetical protein
VANRLRSLLMSWAFCGAYAICIGGAPSWIYMEGAAVNGPSQDDMAVVLAGASNDLTQVTPRDHIDRPKVALNQSAPAKHLDGVAQVQTLNAGARTRRSVIGKPGDNSSQVHIHKNSLALYLLLRASAGDSGRIAVLH